MSDRDEARIRAAEAARNPFESRAEAYLKSAVHAGGPDLDRARCLVEGAVSPQVGRALDIGCGAGHLSFALAQVLASVVAYDPSPGMLVTVGEAALARNLPRIETRRGSAEALPFPDASFGLVCTRYSAHHWRDLERALQEARRVLEPGGYALVIDVLGKEDPLVDTHLQAMELLRDASHVRNRSRAEWRALIANAGFTLLECATYPLRLAFDPWIDRMCTPAPRVAAIRSLQAEAPRDVSAELGFEPDGSFTVEAGLFWARAAS